MIELTSKRPTMTVSVDGDETKIPITLNRKEFTSLAPIISKISDTKDADVMAEFGPIIEWFSDFARPYLGEIVDECGNNELMNLFKEWFSEFRAASGVETVGESQSSPSHCIDMVGKLNTI